MLDLGTLGGSWDYQGGVVHGKNLPGMLLEACRTPLVGKSMGMSNPWVTDSGHRCGYILGTGAGLLLGCT